VTIQRLRGRRARAELIEWLRGNEPRTTLTLASLIGPAAHERTKLWAARRDGRIVGCLLSARWCLDRWSGTLLLDDLSCAGELARALDRSNLRTVAGPVEQVEAVLPLTKRARRSIRLWFYSVAPLPPEAAGAFDRNREVAIRGAAASDLDAVVDVYAHDEHSGGVSRRRLRSAIRSRLPYMRVAEIGGRVVGALIVPQTDTYWVLDMLAVHPDWRGNRLGMALILDASVDAVTEGRGVCGVRTMTNGMRLGHDDVVAVGDSEPWAVADLRPPKRFRGQTRLRRLVERLEGGVITPPRPERSPYSVLPEQRPRTLSDADEARAPSQPGDVSPTEDA